MSNLVPQHTKFSFNKIRAYLLIQKGNKALLKVWIHPQPSARIIMSESSAAPLAGSNGSTEQQSNCKDLENAARGQQTQGVQSPDAQLQGVQDCYV